MPLDIFSLASTVGLEIIDRLDRLQLSESTATRIRESLEYMRLSISKIEPHVQDDSADAKEIKEFLTHLQRASESCAAVAEKHRAVKLLNAASVLDTLLTIEDEVKLANSKLLLFISTHNLKMFCEFTDAQNRKLDKIAAIQENARAGLDIVVDTSVRRPPAPSDLTIQERKNEFELRWKPSEGTVDSYEVCYNEHDNLTFSVGNASNARIGSPRVLPGKLYTMKVRGINRGGAGEWSNTVVGQFTKPLPQKPVISDLFLRSTMAGVSIKIPEAICNTESPVTCVEVSYVSTTSTQWSNFEFKIKPTGKDTHTFTVRGLQPDSKYNFRTRTKNAEGWSDPSDLKEEKTLTLPPKPAQPKSPSIIPYTLTEVYVEALVPENTCSMVSPIIAWRMSGYGAEKEEIDKYYEVYEACYMDEFNVFILGDLDPNQHYTLHLYAKNENGWSDPSEKFTVHIATPSVPRFVRASSNRSHSLIKIRWNVPDSILITHYEIIKKFKNGDYDKPIQAPANKFSATFKNLWSNTFYYFKVRTCNGLNVSSWSTELEINTRTHKAIKAALSPFVWAFGTAASPLLTPIVAGTAAGKYANETSGTVASVAAGAAGTIGGTAAGILGAPFVGAGFAHAFVHGIDELSDQSEDEDAVIIEE